MFGMHGIIHHKKTLVNGFCIFMHPFGETTIQQGDLYHYIIQYDRVSEKFPER